MQIQFKGWKQKGSIHFFIQQHFKPFYFNPLSYQER